MTAVMIGVDPHKGSHTAVAIGAAEEPLGNLRVRASVGRAQRLATWAATWPERTWAVEGAGGLGHLLAQQLVAAGELVLDVQPKLGARVRLLATGDSNKNDPNDALPVAVAAPRSRTWRQVRADDHQAVLRVWSRRHRDLGRAKNQAACRLQALAVPDGRVRDRRRVQHRSGGPCRVAKRGDLRSADQRVGAHEQAVQLRLGVGELQRLRPGRRAGARQQRACHPHQPYVLEADGDLGSDRQCPWNPAHPARKPGSLARPYTENQRCPLANK